MKALSLLNKRKTLFCVILFIAFSAFTANILDLREELNIISCPYAGIDNNVSSGIVSSFTFASEPIFVSGFVDHQSSFHISLLHLIPFGFRAPPSVS